MTEEKPPIPDPEKDKKTAMIELGRLLSNGEITKRDVDLAALVGHQPARDLLVLMGDEDLESPSKPEELLEVLESWQGAHIRALIASVHARICAEEIALESLDPREKKHRQRSTQASRNILSAIESYFLNKDLQLGLDLTAAASSLDEAIGETAQMMSGGQLSEQYMKALAIDLELEKLIRLLGLMLEETHSIPLSPLDLQAVRREILAWALEKKDLIQERVSARAAQQGQQSTRDQITDVTQTQDPEKPLGPQE